jgi:cephalosporin-C deacetylase
MAVAAAAIGKGVRGVSAEIPFMTSIPRAIEEVSTYPYSDLGDYLAAHPDQTETVMKTLSYFDTVSLASMVDVPTIISYGEADIHCPESTIKPLFDALHCVKAMVGYPGRDHIRAADFMELSMAWFGTHC